jgi:hypothetical protein
MLANVEPRKFEPLPCNGGTILWWGWMNGENAAIVVLATLAHFLSFQRFVLIVSGERSR